MTQFSFLTKGIDERTTAFQTLGDFLHGEQRGVIQQVRVHGAVSIYLGSRMISRRLPSVAYQMGLVRAVVGVRSLAVVKRQ